MVTTTRASLARHVAAAMPPKHIGTSGRMVGYTPRVRGDEPPSTYFRDSTGRPPVEERIRAFLRAPRAAEGHFTITAHVLRSLSPMYLSWVDIREDRPAAGRYVIAVDDNETTVAPASRQDIERRLLDLASSNAAHRDGRWPARCRRPQPGWICHPRRTTGSSRLNARLHDEELSNSHAGLWCLESSVTQFF